jgi:hypothetical protein
MYKIIKPNGEVYKEGFDSQDDAEYALMAYWGTYAYALGFTIKQEMKG